MVYCISILENFSRAILASAISLRQDTEAFFAVFYAAVRKHGVPEILVSGQRQRVYLSRDQARVRAARNRKEGDQKGTTLIKII